jgi:hypothetical protein
MTNYDKIARRAYQLWERAGKPCGKDKEHWLQAEVEIKREEFQQAPRGNSPAPQELNARRGRRVFAA